MDRPESPPNLPKVTEEQRRIVREEYRELSSTMLENKERLIESNDDFKAVLNKSTQLFKQVTLPREAALDAKVFMNVSSIVQSKCKKMAAEFNVAEFAFKCKQSVDATEHGWNKEKWVKFGRHVHACLKTTAQTQFFNGTLGKEYVRKEKVAREKTKDVLGKKTAPTQLQALKLTDNEEMTTEQVEHVYNILTYFYKKWNQNKAQPTPICFYQFVVHPESFGQTVENIFHTSFLIKDGVVRLYLDDNKLPVIEPILDDGERGQEAGQKTQAIVSITVEEWEKIVEVFEIKAALIPPRESNN